MSYTQRQIARDAAYSRNYREWVASLPPEERAKLQAGGIAEPDTSRRTSTRLGDPLALEHAASPEASPSAVCDTDPSSTSTSTSDFNSAVAAVATAADVLASFCARIRAHPNPRLAFDAACFASGLVDVEGPSESALAKRHGVTRAAFSKLVVQWSETFGLPPSRGMRSKSARTVYRRARLTSLSQHDAAAA